MGGITESMDMSLSKLWKLVMDTEPQHAAVRGVSKTGQSPSLDKTETLNRIELSWSYVFFKGASIF